MDIPRTIKAPPALDRSWVAACGLLGGAKPGGRLTLDLSETVRIDSAGVCFIELLRRMYREQGEIGRAHV